MNRENPYLFPGIIQNLGRIGSRKDVGRMRQLSKMYNQLMSSVYFDWSNKIFYICEYGDGRLCMCTLVDEVEVKVDIEELEGRTRRQNPECLLQFSKEIFRKIEVEEKYNFDTAGDEVLVKLPAVLSPYIKEIHINQCLILSKRQGKSIDNIIKFINNFHPETTVILRFEGKSSWYTELLNIETIIENIPTSKKVIVKKDLHKWNIEDKISEFKVFPNMTWDIDLDTYLRLDYQYFTQISQFFLANIKNLELGLFFAFSEKLFPNNVEKPFRNLLCQLNDKLVRLRFDLGPDENLAYRNTLDSIKFPNLKYLYLANYPNVSKVLYNCPRLEEFKLNVKQSSIFIDNNSKTDKENLARFLGVDDRVKLIYLTIFTYFYAGEDKMTSGSEIDKYLKCLLPNVIKFIAYKISY